MKIIEMIAGSRGMGDAKSMAEMLRRMGRRGDTMLAHITPEEADMLMEAGGAGTINPDTGLPEFYNPYDFDSRYRPPVSYGTTRSNIVDTITAPESQIGRVPRSSSFESDFRGEPVPTSFDTPIQQRSDTYFSRRQGVPAYAGGQDFVGRSQPAPSQAPESRSSAFVPNYPNVGRSTEFEQIPQLRQTEARPTTDTYYSNQPFVAPYGTRPVGELTPLEDFTLNRMDVDVGRGGGGGGFAEQAEAGIQEFRDLLDRYPNLTRTGTAAASILAQALMFNRANESMRRDIEQTRRAAEPFRQGQSEAMSRATGGGLTAEQEQELEIAQSRARQGLGDRGMQTGSAASGILASQQRRARSLARQESFQEALRLANIADQYDRRALEMELQRDQQLAQLFAGIIGREVQQAQRTEAPVPTNQVQPAR
jgi:hypothetical protein